MTITTLMTADDLLRLPDDGFQHELIDGVLLTRSPDNFRHSVIADRLHVPMSVFARRNGLGQVSQNAGFILRGDPDTVLAPDIAFVPADRAPLVGGHRGFYQGYPDLAVEILSPSNTAEELARKNRLYFAAGVRLVWIVDPESRTVAVHSSENRSQTLTPDQILDGGIVLPGFALAVADIFA